MLMLFKYTNFIKKNGGSDHLFQLLLTLLTAVVLSSANDSVFLVHPVSINTTEGREVQFICVAIDSTVINFFVNNDPATDTSVINKGFMQTSDQLDGGLRRANLTVTASSSLNNNSTIKCTASPSNIHSDEVLLRVQGPLSVVGDLAYSFISCSNINISWSSPFTLPGTDITGYNISATSNGITTNYFTSNSYYQLLIPSKFPFNDIMINVSGYNGLEGEPTTLDTIVPPAQNISLLTDVILDSTFNISLSSSINTANICPYQYPTLLQYQLFYDERLISNNSLVYTDVVNIEYPLGITNNQVYTIIVRFTNELAPDLYQYNIINTAFDTYDLVSANVLNSSNSTVCVECVFAPYSLDNAECTVQLISTDNTYTQTFTKSSSSSVVGCIHNISTGEYSITVYAFNGPAVYKDTVTVTELSEHITATSTVSSSAYSTDMVSSSVYLNDTFDDDDYNSTEQSSGSTTTLIVISVTVPTTIIIIIVSVLIIIVVVAMKNKHNQVDTTKTEIIIQQENFVLQNVNTTTEIYPDKNSTTPPSKDETRPSSNETKPTTRDESPPPPIPERRFDMTDDDTVNWSYTTTLQQATPTSSQLTSSHKFPSDYFLVGDPYSNTSIKDPTEPPEIPMYAEVPKDPKLITRKKPAQIALNSMLHYIMTITDLQLKYNLQ